MEEAKMEGSTHSVVTLFLRTRPFQEHVIEKRFEVARKLSNSLLAHEMKKYKKLTRTPEYQEIQAEILAVLDEYSEETQEEIGDDAPEKRKLNPAYRTDERYKAALKKRSTLIREGGFLGQFSFQKDLAVLKNYYETRVVNGKKKQHPQIGAQVLNKLAVDVWKSMEGHIYKGKKVHYIRKGELNTLSSGNAKTPMYMQGDLFFWHGIECNVVIDPKDTYLAEMLQKEAAFYRVVRKTIKGKNRYYVQIVLKGAPLRKRVNATGEYKHVISKNAAGVDVGLSCVAIVSDNEVGLFPLAPNAKMDTDRKEELQQFLSRSRFENNPHRFNKNGTIRKLPRKSENRYWVTSKRYLVVKKDIREMDRLSAAIRKDDHGALANRILSIASEIKMEKINYQSLQKREKETSVLPSGRIKSKKRGGAKILSGSPGLFVEKLTQKVRDYAGRNINWVDPKTVKASKYDHVSNQYFEKRPFDKEFAVLSNGDRINQYLYNAFLLNCLKENRIDNDICNQKYAKFKLMHDALLKNET